MRKHAAEHRQELAGGSIVLRAAAGAGLVLWMTAGAWVLAAQGSAPEPAPDAKAGTARKDATATAAAKPAETEKKEKDLYAMSMRELRDYQSFYYASGLRDPMTFRLVRPVETTRPKETAGTVPVKPEVTNNAPSIPEQRRFLRESIMRAELLMLAHDYNGVVSLVQEVDKLIQSEWRTDRLVPDLQALWNDLKYDYGMTATRLQHAADTRKEFANMNLQALGIRWTPHGAVALVNDRLYEMGEAVQGLKVTDRVQIAEIEESAVVFMYKGQRFRVEVGTTGAAEAAR